MKVLIVYAHPEPRSFNGALRDRALQALSAQGHSVELSDLYAMAWSPAIEAADFEGARQNADFLDVSKEQEHAYLTGTQNQRILAEQKKVAAADLVIFQFPVWWFSMPAIMKGWVDKVLSRGFAYSSGRKYGTGHFTGKRAMLSITTGTAETLYEPNGIDGDLMHILWPIHNGILAYIGFEVLPPFVAWAPAASSDEQRQQYLDDYEAHLGQMGSATPLYFHPWSDYDRTQRLKPGIKAMSGVQWNVQADQTFEESAQSHRRHQRRK